jgi:hypothetical protein
MKPIRIILAALAVLVVAGTIANAAPGGVHGKPTPSPSVNASPTSEPTETESPEPSETESPEPTETESPDAKPADKTGKAPDFSGCVGLTGLGNAICRHRALLKIHPDNPGLNNSLTHLQANAAKHAAAGTHGRSGS